MELALLLQGMRLPACKILLFAGQSPQEMLAAAGRKSSEFHDGAAAVHPTRMVERAAAWHPRRRRVSWGS